MCLVADMMHFYLKLTHGGDGQETAEQLYTHREEHRLLRCDTV